MIQDTAKALQADIALADMCVPVAMRAELHLGVICVNYGDILKAKRF